MKRIWVRGGICAVVGVLSCIPLAQAASGDADGTYTVTVTKVEASQDGGSTFSTLFSGSQDINIASAAAGAAAASLVSGAEVSPGSYNRIRVTIGGDLRVKGYVNNGATTLYTNNDSDGFGLNASAADTPGTDYTISIFSIPEANRTSTNTVSITVQQSGATPTVQVSFDTSGVITQSGGTPSLNAPSVSVTSA